MAKLVRAIISVSRLSIAGSILSGSGSGGSGRADHMRRRWRSFAIASTSAFTASTKAWGSARLRYLPARPARSALAIAGTLSGKTYLFVIFASAVSITSLRVAASIDAAGVELVAGPADWTGCAAAGTVAHASSHGRWNISRRVLMLRLPSINHYHDICRIKSQASLRMWRTTTTRRDYRTSQSERRGHASEPGRR